jgi:hypothetical protein
LQHSIGAGPDKRLIDPGSPELPYRHRIAGDRVRKGDVGFNVGDMDGMNALKGRIAVA